MTHPSPCTNPDCKHKARDHQRKAKQQFDKNPSLGWWGYCKVPGCLCTQYKKPHCMIASSMSEDVDGNTFNQ